jgi:hypothetical protein
MVPLLGAMQPTQVMCHDPLPICWVVLLVAVCLLSMLSSLVRMRSYVVASIWVVIRAVLTSSVLVLVS